MSLYQVNGLKVASAVALPELPEVQGDADVEIRPGTLAPLPFDTKEDYSVTHANENEIYLYWRNVGTFLIRNGREIIIDSAPGVDDKVLRLFLLGRVLGSMLHQRGQMVLHASAVDIKGSAVAFLGGKGFGKSTTAAAFYFEGYPIVADDVLALDIDSAGFPTVNPGFPQLKLWPEAASSLGDAVETLPRLHPDFEKRARQVDRGFSSSPLPLKRIYVLADGDLHQINTLHPQEAFIELVRHSYAVRLLETTGASSRHFNQCSRLIDSLGVRRLSRPASLGRLTELVRIVEKDLSDSE